MIKTWFRKKKKETLIIPCSIDNRSFGLELITKSGLARFNVRTSDGLQWNQMLGFSTGITPTAERTFYVELIGNLKFKTITQFNMWFNTQMFFNTFSKSILEVFPNLEKWTIYLNNVFSSTANVQKYSGENFATLNLPFLKIFSHRDHSNITGTNRLFLDFNAYGLLPELTYLHWAAIYGAVIVTGDAKYLPRKLKDLSDEGYGTASGFTGKFSDLPDSLESVSTPFSTSQNLIGYTSKTWTGILYSFNIARVTLTSLELDALLIDLANATWRTGPNKQFIITQRVGGGIGVRTSASDSAVAILLGQGIKLQISNNTF